MAIIIESIFETFRKCMWKKNRRNNNLWWGRFSV